MNHIPENNNWREVDAKVYLDIDEGVLIGRLETQASLNKYEYAFYLLLDGKRVETHWYSDEPFVRFRAHPSVGLYRAVGFVKRCCDAQVKMFVSVPLRRVAQRAGDNIISSAVVRTGNIANVPLLLLNATRLRLDLTVPNLPFVYQCLLIRKPGDKIFVILGGGVPDRAHITLPRFSRATWAADFPGTVLYIADPTLLLGETLRLGWYFGAIHADATEGLAAVINAIANALSFETKQVVTYGSSGGGFAAIQVVTRLGNGATGIAINAQTAILDFGQKDSVQEFLTVCTRGMAAPSAQVACPDRLRLVDAMERPSSASGRFLFVQNIQDHHHYRDHLKPLVSYLGVAIPSICGRIGIMLYDFPNGHGAEPRSMVPQILNEIEKLHVVV